MLAPASAHAGTQSRIDAIVRRAPDTVRLLLITPQAQATFEQQGGGDWSNVNGVWVCPLRDADSSLDQLRAAGLTFKEV